MVGVAVRLPALLRPFERFCSGLGRRGSLLSLLHDPLVQLLGVRIKIGLGVFTVSPTHGALKLAGDTRLSID